VTIGVSIISDHIVQLSERTAAFALSVARRLGMEPPSEEEKLVPFAFEVMQRAFGTNPLTERPAPPK
jgi:hypothetical protein